MTKEFTDFELASQFGALVAQTYDTAVKFIDLNPDHALMEFRTLATLLCNIIFEKANEPFQHKTLEEKIDFLALSQLINFETKNNFHKIRGHGNSSTHKHDLIAAEDEASFLKLSKENFIEGANEVRRLVVDVFSDLYVFWLKKGRLGKVVLLEVKSESYKEILLQAALSNDPTIKFSAGMIYKSIANNFQNRSQLIIPAEGFTNLTFLRDCALAHFKASYELSVSIGLAPLTKEEKNEKYLKLCDLNSLYEYASLIYHNELENEYNKEGIKLLEVAADRGFGPAEAKFSIHLYDDLKDYELAKKYAERAIEQNISEGHRLLFHYFSGGEAIEPNIKEALYHINLAIIADNTEAMYNLGSAYQESDHIQQDIELSKKYLLMAIERGHKQAFLYHEVHFNNLAENMASQLKALGEQMLLATEPQKQIQVRSQKQHRNKKCQCGSGLKFKKCHGSPAMQATILKEIRNSHH